MTVSRPPDVWVKDTTRNTPAHRVVNPEQYLTTDGDPVAELPTVIDVACPPFLAVGGIIVGRQRAVNLHAMPCALCFGIDLRPGAAPNRRTTR